MPVEPIPCADGGGTTPVDVITCCSPSIASAPLCRADGTAVLLVVRSGCDECGGAAPDPEAVGWIDAVSGAFTAGALPADAGPCAAGCSCSPSIATTPLCRPDGTSVLVVVRSDCADCDTPAPNPVVVGWLDPLTGVFTLGAAPADAGPCDPGCVETVCRQRCDDADGDGNADTTYSELWCIRADGSADLVLTYRDDPSVPYTPVAPLDCTYGAFETETVMLCDDTGPFLRRYTFLDGTAAYEDVELDGRTPHVVTGEVSTCSAATDCEAPTTPAATLGLCLADGTPIAVLVTRDCEGTVTQDGWLNLATGAYSAGAPPAGTVACGSSRSITTNGTFCDIDPDSGDVLGLVLVEYTYGPDGTIAAVRLVDATTGQTYTPTGTITTCPAGTAQPEQDLLQLCDTADDRTVTGFVRDYRRDENGAITGHSDYTLDGTPYTPAGTVGVCAPESADMVSCGLDLDDPASGVSGMITTGTDVNPFDVFTDTELDAEHNDVSYGLSESLSGATTVIPPWTLTGNCTSGTQGNGWQAVRLPAYPRPACDDGTVTVTLEYDLTNTGPSNALGQWVDARLVSVSSGVQTIHDVQGGGSAPRAGSVRHIAHSAVIPAGILAAGDLYWDIRIETRHAGCKGWTVSHAVGAYEYGVEGCTTPPQKAQLVKLCEPLVVPPAAPAPEHDLVVLCDTAEDGTVTQVARDFRRDASGAVVGYADYDLEGIPYTVTGTVARCPEDHEPGVDVETLRMCVIDNESGGSIQEILAELHYDTETGTRTGVAYVDPLTWGPVALPGGTHIGLCPDPAEPDPAPDVAVLQLCDTSGDGTSTAFLRHLVYPAGATAPTVVDTALDGTTPYAPVGTVGTCAPTEETCRNTTSVLLCDLDDSPAGGDGSPVLTDDSTPHRQSNVPGLAHLAGGGQTLWDGGALDFPADPDGSAGTGNQVNRWINAAITAAAPACDDGTGTATVTVSVDVTPDDWACGGYGFFGLFGPDGSSLANSGVGLGDRGPTAAGETLTRTLTAEVTAADLAAGRIVVWLNLRTYITDVTTQTNGQGGACTPAADGPLGWTAENFAVTVEQHPAEACTEQFLRHVTVDCETGAVLTVSDTDLDGDPYTVAGEVGQCAAAAPDTPPCVVQSVLEACRCDDTDGDGLPDTGYVELLGVDCNGQLISLGTYTNGLVEPYAPVAPVGCDVLDDDEGAPPAFGVQARRVELAAGASWDASVWPTLQSVTAVAFGGDGTVTTADGPSTLHAGEAATWSVARDADAALTGPLTITAVTGTVTLTYTIGVQL